MPLISLGVVIYAAMILEAVRARRNERTKRALGGVEPAGDVYAAMRVAYPAAFAAMLAEAFVRQKPPSPAIVLGGVAVFAFGKAIKWWAIATLGRFWTFRVIVVPGAELVSGGPYRFVRHPNYVGVVAELVGTLLMTGAFVTGPAAVALFGLLLLKRIGVEDRGLLMASKEQAMFDRRGT